MSNAKLNIMEETFEKEFKIERFKKFTKEFFNEPKMLKETRHTGIWREYSDFVNSYYTVADYQDNDGNNIIVMAVELKKNTSIDRARSMQRNFISKILDINNLEAAIVAFYTDDVSSWRLSFVRLDYSFTGNGIELELTPARRYSYLLGENEPNHTAKEQLYPIFKDDKHNPTLTEIENAFSVEKVTKVFFNQYKEKYLELKEFLEQDKSFVDETKKLGFKVNKFSEQFSKKLMGQLAFLYFLQKKGWLGVRIMPETHSFTEDSFKEIYSKHEQSHKKILDKVFIKTKDGFRKLYVKKLLEIDSHEAELLSDCFVGTPYEMPWGSGNKQFIREIFDFCENKTNKNFFDEYLEPFFYEALNKKRKNHYFKKFNCKIPFLNGGLFEPIEGYHWQDTNFEIPNDFFSNKNEKGRKADGILDIFDRYNFTMNEDEPLEKEVAIDPEMLGKIFENLLEVSDRKSQGAYFSPRDIVHYMCQESLINYLVSEVSVPYDDIKEFILYGELIKDQDSRSNVKSKEAFESNKKIKQSIFDNIIEIDKALENVRIADPAVGSGAFPLGMLNEIVKARNNITEYIIRKNKEGSLNKQYEEDFIRRWRSPYEMKIKTIKNSIFAVDIDPSAVDIAKLRLWLSIVVEQEINNRIKEPHPLPNLDMNIHVGNSLIDEYEGIKLFDKSVLENTNKKDKKNNNPSSNNFQISMLIDHSDEMLKEMFDLQDRYFSEDNIEKKKEYKSKIDSIRDDLIRYKLKKDGNKLASYEKSLRNNIKPYFIWELEFGRVFKENNGFDIVIGNPPYVGEKGNKEIFRPISKTNFGNKFYNAKMDLYYYFFHKSIDISKQNGIISFITTNYYVTATGGKKLRSDIKERTAILKLINFNELKIFESALGQHNLITILQKGNKEKEAMTSVCYKKGFAKSKDLINICNFKSINDVEQYKLNQNQIFDGDKQNYIRIEGNNKSENSSNQILSKMTNKSILLGAISNVNQGARTGADKVTNHHIKKYDLNVNKGEGIFVVNDKLNLESDIIKPWFKNSDIYKYMTKSEPSNFVIYTKNNIEIEKYPNILNHLSKYKSILEGRWSKYPWWCLDRPRKQEIFESSKIVCPQRSYLNTFAYNDIPWYSSADVYYITKKNENFNLKYILSILNSKLCYFWLYFRGKRKGEMLELYQKPLSEIPIKRVSKEEQLKIANKTDVLIEHLKANNFKENLQVDKESSRLKKELDYMIYNLYDLNDKEIEIVEKKYPDKKEV